jgi:flagellar operon protein
MEMRINSMEPVHAGIQSAGCARKACAGNADFAAVLAEKTRDLKFSAHAQARMKSRNMDMTPDMIEKLDTAVSGAQKKGAKDSLVLLSNMAFIVNIASRTVVTAMDGDNLREKLFTNIDSAVIAG